ncbi:MAG: BREX-6 system BrxE protein [Deltaproteobacteria bacterium]|nr:BREX-6 system BrxE protein [Deltaproteobacteria bacterium]
MQALDDILALQFAIAWAGEGRSDPKRLGWWDTDLVDEAGGGDFFLRLAPRTHAWAALDAVREAARRVDEKGRKKMAEPDLVRTLFFLGFDLDEQLADRLLAHKRTGRTPADVLRFPFPLGSKFEKAAVATALTAPGQEPFTVVPGGRQLRGTAPSEPFVLARRLAAGLVPFTEAYPAPFFKVAP